MLPRHSAPGAALPPTPPSRRGRRAPLHEIGTDPDPRFSYANERTFLAWNRTALALIAAGLAVTTLLPEFAFEYGRRIIGVPLIALGAVLSISSFRRWDANERAIRLGRPLLLRAISLFLIIQSLSSPLSFRTPARPKTGNEKAPPQGGPA